MLVAKRTNSNDTDFITLVAELNKDLAVRNGESNDFFMQFNNIDLINHVVLIYENEVAVGCGAMKEYNSTSMEIKRMFVPIKNRKRGIAQMVLNELQTWAKELNYKTCVLETGDKMPEAIGLYKKSGFVITPNYGPYAGVESSICFEKHL